MKSFGCKLCRVISIPFTIYSGWERERVSDSCLRFWLQMRFSPDSLTHLGWKIGSAYAFCFTFFSPGCLKSNDLWTLLCFLAFTMEKIKSDWEGWNMNSSCNLNIFSDENTLNFHTNRTLSAINFFKIQKTSKLFIINHRTASMLFVWVHALPSLHGDEPAVQFRSYSSLSRSIGYRGIYMKNIVQLFLMWHMWKHFFYDFFEVFATIFDSCNFLDGWILLF